MQTKLSIFCDKMLEAGCLLTVVITPLFFNVSSNRAFEPDKISIVRSIALIMTVAWLIKAIDGRGQRRRVAGTNGDGGVLNQGLWQRLIRTPLILPVMLFVGSYLLSTLLSVAPRISLLGSYLRLQGTYTTFSYIIIFFLTLVTIQRQEQIDRLCNAIIFTSLPISLYGILEHYHLDPIAWGTDVTTRVTSSMGNPIFLAAYLIMVVPVTLSRIIESTTNFLKEQERREKILCLLLSCCYTVVIGVQLICIIFTQSRGPWLGLLGGLYIFMLVALISLRNSAGGQDHLNLRELLKAIAFTVLSIPLGVVPAYIVLILLKRGWRWLWLSWIFHTLVAAGFLILFNLPNTPLAPLQKVPYIGRLGEISQTELGTGKVRMLIWEGTLNLLKANPLRTIIGYGPEAMQLVYGPYYPLDLAHHEQRNTLPDRSHNETLDTLVITGVIGFVVYMFLFGSLFYYGMKWLGFMETKKQSSLFLFLSFVGAVSGIFLPKLVEGTYRMSGVGLPVGFIAATCLYFLLSAIFFQVREQQTAGLKRQLLLIALFSAIVAHFIEIHFGIAVVATRVYLWVSAALFVVLGWSQARGETEARTILSESRSLSQQEQPGKRSRQITRQAHQPERSPARKSGQWSLTSRVLAGSFLAALVLFTLGFEFCINPQGSVDSLSIIHDSFMTLGPSGNFKTSYALPFLFFLTWLVGALVVLVDAGRTSSSRQKGAWWLSASSIYTAVTLTIFAAGVITYASLIKPDRDCSIIITFYYCALALLLLLIAFTLMFEGPLPEKRWRTKSIWMYPLLIVPVCWAIIVTNVRTIQADIYYKQGLKTEKEQRWNETIQLFKKAISLAPFQDNFHTDLSRALIEKSGMVNNRTEKSQLFEEILKTLTLAQQLNPLTPDHYANIGLLYLKWADVASSQEERKKYLDLSDFSYEKAARLDPHNTQIYDCWAIAHIMRGDYDGALKRLTLSLSKDNRYGYTYFILGELYFAQGRLSEAANAYQQAVTYDPRNAQTFCSLGYTYYKQGNLKAARDAYLESIRLDPLFANAHSNLGLIYYNLGQSQLAIEENLKVLQVRPDDLISHRNLALLYRQEKERDKALSHAQEALKLSPESEKAVMQNLINQLKEQKGQS
jgi:tetratricopeptide (TPR) repeat protein